MFSPNCRSARQGKSCRAVTRIAATNSAVELSNPWQCHSAYRPALSSMANAQSPVLPLIQKLSFGETTNQ
jgi:hypothetical protein